MGEISREMFSVRTLNLRALSLAWQWTALSQIGAKVEGLLELEFRNTKLEYGTRISEILD